MEGREQIDKPLRDLMEIIHFTENVSAKIHGVLDEVEIYKAVREEFAKSKRYTASILLLTDDGSKLRIAETSIPSGKLKAGEKAARVRLKAYKIHLNKSSIFSQVVREGKTIQVNVSDIIGELFPRPLAHLISKTMGYEKTPSILTPLKRHGEITGALGISSTELAEHFIPSVRNLAQHISNALELANEYAERVRAEEELRKYQDHLEDLVEERTAELIRANEQLQWEITERKRAEEEVRRLSQFLDSVIDNANVWLNVLDEKANVVVWNKAAEEISGYPREEVVGHGKIWEWLYPDEEYHNTVFAEAVAIIEEGKEEQDTETTIRRKDGQTRVISWNSRSLVDEQGTPIGSIAIGRDVTESKRAEEELRREREKFQVLVEESPLGVSIIREDGHYEYVNSKFVKIFGYTLEDIPTGREWFAKAYPDQEYKDHVISTWVTDQRESKRGEARPRTFAVTCKDSSEKVIHFRPVTMETGDQFVIYEDITERKRAEAALRESEETARALLNAPTESAILLDTRGTILALNETAAQRLGKSVDELVGLDIYDLFSPAVARSRKARIDEAIRSGEHVRFEDERRGRFFDSRIYPVFDAQGKVVRVAVFANDITERKRAERLLRALNQAALAMGRALTHEEMFAAVAEELKKLGFSCMVFLTDESQSRLFTKYLSYETAAFKAAEKLVGLQYEDFSIPIEDVDVYRKVVREKETVFVENAEDIVRQVLPDFARKFAGQIVRMLKVPKSIPAPLIVEDEVIGVFSVPSDDLTEDDVPAITAFAHQMAAAWRKAELMQDLERSLEELKRTQAQLVQVQKMEAIGQLAAGIAHDFNNLLTTMGGFAQLMLRKAPEGSQQHRDLLQIKIAAERAADLTRQLRLFTRQEEGERRPIQLNSVVEETHDLLERSISKEITIELHLESELWVVEADPSQISQVLMNLCVNARDAMSDGGTLILETRNVTLDEEEAQAILAARPGRYMCLSVSDTGGGMSPEVQARLFEPFFTTKGPGKGTGLGLAVAYGIVKGHNGFINVYSEVGQGSTFHIYLPAIELAVEEGEVEELELPTGSETILLVDDEETIRKLGERILKQCGYTVRKAENGVQALEVYQAHRGEIALVVLDVVMPEMGGRQCLRRLRELDPQVKVLISTGYTADGSAQELVAEGALGIVEKPFLLQNFAMAVRATLEKS